MNDLSLLSLSHYRKAAVFLLVSLLAACGGSGGSGGTDRLPITGIVAGLNGTGLILQNNNGDDLAISADGNFRFATMHNIGSSYSVTVLQQPQQLQQNCQVSNGSGVIGADSVPVLVSCTDVKPDTVPELTLEYGQKTFRYNWQPVANASYYRLYESVDEQSGYVQVGAEITDTHFEHTVSLHQRMGASYLLEACNGGGCTMSALSFPDVNQAIGYIKASNTDTKHEFGAVLALSADGTTLVVAADSESSSARGINGDQNNTDSIRSGAVYIFGQESGRWVQKAYIKSSNSDISDYFGSSLGLSADGNTLAVGAPGESSSSTGVNGDQNNNDMPYSGAVYIFTRNDSGWQQQGYLKAADVGEYDHFGQSLELSAAGNVLVVGAPGEDSNAMGINGDGANNDVQSSGAAYVFSRGNNGWQQQAYLKASNTGNGDQYGTSVSISADALTIAIGAPNESGGSVGINGDQSPHSDQYYSAGAVYVYAFSDNNWAQQAYIKGAYTDSGDDIGEAVSLSADGNTLLATALREDGGVSGVNGVESDNSVPNSGAAYVFVRTGTDWAQQAYLKASNPEGFDSLGAVGQISSDGRTIAVQAREDSGATGINGDQSDNNAERSGAVYLFHWNDGEWLQQAYVKASNTDEWDEFGSGIALSADGSMLAVGAKREKSASRGIGGDQSDNTLTNAGAVYLY